MTTVANRLCEDYSLLECDNT